jgi:hypothetical protein
MSPVIIDHPANVPRASRASAHSVSRSRRGMRKARWRSGPAPMVGVGDTPSAMRGGALTAMKTTVPIRMAMPHPNCHRWRWWASNKCKQRVATAPTMLTTTNATTVLDVSVLLTLTPTLTSTPTRRRFDSCGQSILDDYMEGSPVVLFAYGLSGSGKTYTVFGPDAPSSPDAWYLFNEPHSSWGIFPRVGEYWRSTNTRRPKPSRPHHPPTRPRAHSSPLHST